MAKYKEFDRGKYQSSFDQMFGEGRYEQGMQSARDTGRLKVEASLARKAYEKRIKEEEAARKKAEKEKAKALPTASEGRKKPESNKGDGVFDKLLGGAKAVYKGVHRFDDIMSNAMTLGLKGESDKRIQKKADAKGVNMNLTEYLNPREKGDYVGKGMDLLASLVGYGVTGIGATQALRGAGITGKGINALTQASKAGNVTKPLLKRAAIDSAKEGALIGGAMATGESAVRLGLNKEADTSLKRELGNVALGTALGGALDPLATVAAPALKYASRSAVDNAIVNQGAESLGQAVRRADVSPQGLRMASENPVNIGTQQLNEMLLGRQNRPEQVLQQLVRSRNPMTNMDVPTNVPVAPQARAAQQVMNEVSSGRIDPRMKARLPNDLTAGSSRAERINPLAPAASHEQALATAQLRNLQMDKQAVDAELARLLPRQNRSNIRQIHQLQKQARELESVISEVSKRQEYFTMPRRPVLEGSEISSSQNLRNPLGEFDFGRLQKRRQKVMNDLLGTPKVDPNVESAVNPSQIDADVPLGVGNAPQREVLELELRDLQQERLAVQQLDQTDPEIIKVMQELDDEIAFIQKDLASETIRPVPSIENPKLNASDSLQEMASTRVDNPLDALVPNREPVRPPTPPAEVDVNKSFIDRSVKKPKKDTRTALTKAQQQFTNDTAPLRQIDEQMKQLDANGILEYLNPKTWIKSRTKSLATNSSLEKGMLNAKGSHSVAANHTTSRFSPLLESINKSTATNVEDLGEYAFARHGLTLLDDSANARALRDSALEEIDSIKASLGVDSDEARAMQAILDGYKDYTMPEGATLDVLQAKIAKFEQNPELVKYYDEFMKLQQENLKDMYEGGMITQKLYDSLKENKTYISMHRNFEDVTTTAGMVSRRPQNTLERMGTGSEALIKDPVSEAMRNAYMTKFNIEKNNALQVVEKFATIDKDNIMFKGVKEPNASTITLFKNGKPKHYEVPPELKAYVDNFNPNNDPDVLTNTLQKVAQMQRKLTTQYNISFQLKSLVREPVQAIMTSRTAKSSIHATKNTALGYVDALVGPQLQELTKDLPKALQFNSFKADWDKMGGTGFQYIRMSDDDLQRVAKEMLESGTAKGNIKKLNPFRAIGKFGEKVEEGARLGEFRSAKGQGYSNADAFFEATDITNYKRSGTATSVANKYMPFLNATIQGNSRVLRAFQEAPARTLVRGATMLSTASLGAYSMRFADGVSDEQRQELDNLSQWEKDSYMHIPVPNSETIIAIPKAFAVGQMFMNPVERTLDDYYNAVMKEESVPQHIKEGLKSTLRSFIPPYEVAGITTAYELKQNKSLFTGQEIESQFDRDAGVPKKDIEAYNQSFLTNAISDLLNKMTFDSDSEGIVSPAQVDYFIKDLTGTTGTQALGIMDSLVSEKAPTKTMSDQLLKPINQFKADPTRASGVYEELKKLAVKEKRNNSSMAGMTEDEKNIERASRPLQNYEAAFKDLNKQIQAVRSSKELTSQEKKDAITELRKQQDALGTQAIDWYNSLN